MKKVIATLVRIVINVFQQRSVIFEIPIQKYPEDKKKAAIMDLSGGRYPEKLLIVLYLML